MFELDGTGNDRLLIPVRTTTTSDVISAADSDPVYAIYGPGGTGKMQNGTGTLSQLDTGSVTGAANNGSGSVRITSSGHGLQTGERVTIASVGGTTEANGTWTITRISSSTFDLVGSTFASAYTSGGTWKVTGLYSALHSLASADSYERGKNYTVVVTYAVTSAKSEVHTFTVV